MRTGDSGGGLGSDPGSAAEPSRLLPLWKKRCGLQASLLGKRGPQSAQSLLLPEVVMFAAVRPSPLLSLCPVGPSLANGSATDVQGDHQSKA